MKSYRGRPLARLLHLTVVWTAPVAIGIAWDRIEGTGSIEGAVTGASISVVIAFATAAFNVMTVAGRLLEKDTIFGPGSAQVRAFARIGAAFLNAAFFTLLPGPATAAEAGRSSPTRATEPTQPPA